MTARLFVVAILAIGVGAGISYQLLGPVASLGGTAQVLANSPDDPPGSAEVLRSVGALGRLQPAGGVIEISNILIGDPLVALVEEGTRVEKQEEIGRLDETFRKVDVDLAAARYAEASKRLEADRTSAQTQLENAALALRQASEGAAIVIEAQEKRVEAQRLELRQAENDLARIETLGGSGDSIVSEQELEHQRLLRDKASVAAAAAETELKRLRQAAKFDRETAEANVRTAEVAVEAVDQGSILESLQVQLRLAEERLRRTRITAPIAGTVLKIYTRPGESVAQQPVLQMADLTEFECIAEVFESDIKHISVGNPAQIRSRAFEGPYNDTYVTGRVKRIGNAMPSHEIAPLSPLDPVDRHVVQVVVDLDGQTDKLTQLLAQDRLPDVHHRAQALVNLRVDVTFPQHKSPPVTAGE